MKKIFCHLYLNHIWIQDIYINVLGPVLKPFVLR
jgi:hypothetical protein